MKIILFLAAIAFAVFAVIQYNRTDPALSVWDRIKAAVVSAGTSIGAAVMGWFS